MVDRKTNKTKTSITSTTRKFKKIVRQLQKVIDPELHMNIVDVGLIYGIDISENNDVKITMTLTTPGCPMQDYFRSEIEIVLSDLEFINDVEIDLIWEPKWELGMMNDQAKQDMFSTM